MTQVEAGCLVVLGSIQNQQFGIRGMAQVVECLLSKCEALSEPQYHKNKQKKSAAL
jgi:hypothetical protein